MGGLVSLGDSCKWNALHFHRLMLLLLWTITFTIANKSSTLIDHKREVGSASCTKWNVTRFLSFFSNGDWRLWWWFTQHNEKPWNQIKYGWSPNRRKIRGGLVANTGFVYNEFGCSEYPAVNEQIFFTEKHLWLTSVLKCLFTMSTTRKNVLCEVQSLAFIQRI